MHKRVTYNKRGVTDAENEKAEKKRQEQKSGLRLDPRHVWIYHKMFLQISNFFY